MLRVLRTLGTTSVTALLAVTPMLVAQPSQAVTAPHFAPASKAKIHPGVQMYTKGAQCTANFVFTDRRARVYVGYAAHCAGLRLADYLQKEGADAVNVNGCRAVSRPLGVAVTFNEGGSPGSEGTVVGRGRLVYSSWLTMQQQKERNADRCAYNDFALVRVRDADVAKVNPSVPCLGGPTAIDRDGTTMGDTVYSFGNSMLRAGVEPLSPKVGVSMGDKGHGWSHTVYAAMPGIPGDSGSGWMNQDGQALGILSTLDAKPSTPLANGVGDLSHELAYARMNSGIAGLRLVPGTKPFVGASCATAGVL